MSLPFLAALLLAAAPLSAPEQALVDAAVERIYRPYSDPADLAGSLDAPIYSEETAALLAHWKRVRPAEELDRLNDGDWFCQCQDHDAAVFRATVIKRELLQPGVARIGVRVRLDSENEREARLIFKWQAAAGQAVGWQLDDMITAEMPQGFKATIRQTIAEDEALARSQGQ